MMTSELRAVELVHTGTGVTSAMKITSKAGPRLRGSEEWAVPSSGESILSSALLLLRQASTDSNDQIITVSSSDPESNSLASSLKLRT